MMPLSYFVNMIQVDLVATIRQQIHYLEKNLAKQTICNYVCLEECISTATSHLPAAKH